MDRANADELLDVSGPVQSYVNASVEAMSYWANSLTKKLEDLELGRGATASLPRFTGTAFEDAKVWLQRFELIADLEKWSKAKKLKNLALLLEGSAATWLLGLSDEERSDWDSLVEAFQKQFSHNELVVRGYLHSRKQLPGESVNEYAHSVIAVCKRCGIVSQSELMSQLLSGFHPQIRAHLLLMPVGSVEEMLGAAQRKEMSMQLGGELIAPGIGMGAPGMHAQVPRGMMPAPWMVPSPLAHPTVAAAAMADPARAAQASTSAASLEDKLMAKLDAMRDAMVNAVQALSRQAAPPTRYTNYPRGGPRNMRTTDGRPICFLCQGIGHIARHCPNKGKLDTQGNAAAEAKPSTAAASPSNPQ